MYNLDEFLLGDVRMKEVKKDKRDMIIDVKGNNNVVIVAGRDAIVTDGDINIVHGDKQVVHDSVIMKQEKHDKRTSPPVSMDTTAFGERERDAPVFKPRRDSGYENNSRSCPHCGGRTTFIEHMYCCLSCGKQS